MLKKWRMKYRQMSPVVRSSFWFTFCNFLQRGTALITVPVFTRLLTVEEYGLCNIYFSWFDIFVLLTSLKIPYEGLHNGLIRYEKDKDGYTSSMAGIILTLTIVTGFFYFVCRQKINEITGLNTRFMLVMLIHLMWNPMLVLWMNREKYDFHYRLPLVVTVVSTVLNPILAICMIYFTSLRAEARILGMVLTQCSAGLGCFLFLMIRGRKLYKKEYWHFALSFNLPLFPYYLSQFILNQSDRIMIQFFSGNEKAGLYSVAYSAASLGMLLVSAINGSVTPWIYKKLKAGQREELGRVLLLLCGLVMGINLMITGFAPDLISIMATSEYREAIWIIPPVANSIFFLYLYMTFSSIEMYYGATGFVSLSSVLAAILNFGLNACFIPRCGYMAAGWTTFFCYLFLAGLHYCLLQKIEKRKKKNKKKIIPGKELFLLSLAVIILTFFMMGTYLLGHLRYLLVVGMLIIFWKHKKQFIRLLYKIKMEEK